MLTFELFGGTTVSWRYVAASFISCSLRWSPDGIVHAEPKIVSDAASPLDAPMHASFLYGAGAHPPRRLVGPGKLGDRNDCIRKDRSTVLYR